MGEIFLKLLNMSIAASWLILAVILLRFLLKRAPKWLPCTFWAIVAVRLICPFSLESSLSLIPSTETIPVQNIYSSDPAIADNPHYHHLQSGIPQLDNALTPVLTETKSGVVLRSNIELLAALWIFGMILILSHALVNYLRIHAMVREAVPLKDNVLLCDAVRSPFILGIVRPRIYLPSDMDHEQMDYVLAHERAHLKRRDHWWKPLGYLLLAVYWFNPMVWAAYLLLCRDIELACDEKVIKGMDIKEKKSYSEALVSCSMQRRMIMACPLAFGEVGVKERVKTVLSYKKPAFWLILAAIIACAAVAVCFLTNPKDDSFRISVVIPAGSEESVYYSDEEISPNRNKVTLLTGAGLVDTPVVLKLEFDSQGNAGEELISLTYGMPVKIDAGEDTWFKVGAVMSNPTDEDIVIYVPIKGVEVRIAGHAVDKSATEPDISNLSGSEIEKSGSGISDEMEEEEEDTYNEEDVISFLGVIVGNTMDTLEPTILVKPMGDEIPYEYVAFVLPVEESDWGKLENSLVAITCKDSFEEPQALGPPYGELISIDGVRTSPAQRVYTEAESAITDAILKKYASTYPEHYDFACCDFILLQEMSETPVVGDTTHIITYYGWALYTKFNISAQSLECVGSTHLPLALSFELNGGGYHLKEFWEPGSGSYFVSDVRDKFPSDIAEDGTDSQKFIIPQIQSCYDQAIRYSGLDTEVIVGSLLDTICSAPAASSNPQDYIDAHVIEYHELLYFGEYTLRCCIQRFENSGETGLEGKIMAIICEELLQSKGKNPVDAGTAETGQLWYDTLRAHGSNMLEPYLD